MTALGPCAGVSKDFWTEERPNGENDSGNRGDRGFASRSAASLVCAASAAAPEHRLLSSSRTTLDRKFRSEGVAVGDFNSDGKLDVAAGSVYFAAPDWKMVRARRQAARVRPAQYSDSFANFADDVNGDGRTDLIVVDFPGKQTWWFEQPEKSGGPWKRHEATPVDEQRKPQLSGRRRRRPARAALRLRPGQARRIRQAGGHRACGR